MNVATVLFLEIRFLSRRLSFANFHLGIEEKLWSQSPEEGACSDRHVQGEKRVFLFCLCLCFVLYAKY